jgi:hypothetical protein
MEIGSAFARTEASLAGESVSLRDYWTRTTYEKKHNRSPVRGVGASMYCVAAFAADARRPPPRGYMGIELLMSTEQDLFAKLSPAEATSLFRDLDEVNEGYCYASSSQGIYVAFRRYATAHDNIELSSKPLGDRCKPESIGLKHCIGPLCLGASREEVEHLLGEPLPAPADGEMVMRYEYEEPMFAAQLKGYESFGITSIPVTDVIWLRFDDKGLNSLSMWRLEDLPGASSSATPARRNPAASAGSCHATGCRYR